MSIQRRFERHQFRVKGKKPPRILDKINDRLSEESEPNLASIHPTKGRRFFSERRLRAIMKLAEIKSRLAGNFARV